MKTKTHSLVIARALLSAWILFSAERIPAQETNRYTKVAEQVVALINAGDSSGVEKSFNHSHEGPLGSCFLNSE